MRYTVLSLEQALTLPYATQRFVQLGWRVIRVESPLRGGDPNRYIGEDTGVNDLHAYFLAPNLGKEAITLNLKKKEGRELLKRVIKHLNVDIFMCNTLPCRYEELGIDFESLREANSKLIWCGISALGPDQPQRAGYDPALQALLGYQFLTGEQDREPVLCGLPIIDLKAGDEAFSRVLLALLEQRENPGSFKIDISMGECAASWLITALPQLQFQEDESKLFSRSGNEHRSFIPSNCYPTSDGFVYLAIGSDSQWQKLTGIPGLESLSSEHRTTNEGRKKDKEAIYHEIRMILKSISTVDFLRECLDRNLPAAPVNSIKEVATLNFVADSMVKSRLPSGRLAPLFPAPCSTRFLEQNDYELGPAPRLGEHNEKVLIEAGLKSMDIKDFKQRGII